MGSFFLEPSQLLIVVNANLVILNKSLSGEEFSNRKQAQAWLIHKKGVEENEYASESLCDAKEARMILKYKKCTGLLLSTSIFVLGALSPIAMAQEASDDLMLDQIIVTAQKREQGLQEVPISVSAIGGEAIIDKSLLDLADLQSYTPNFKISQTGTANTVQLRGIYSGQNQGFEQSVGMYVDDIHTGRGNMTKAPLFDLERVEVLKGPQSILFGKNSVAGALNITSAKPQDQFEGYLLADYEFEYGTRSFSGAVTGPITDTLHARLAFKKTDDPGYIFNDFLEKHIGVRDDFGIRASIEWDASDKLLVSAKAERNEFDRDGKTYEVFLQEPERGGPFAGSGFTYAEVLAALTASFGLDGGADLNNELDLIMSTGEEFDKNTVDSFVLNAVYDADNGGVFTSTTGFLDGKSDELCDCDFTSVDIFTFDFHEQYEQLSQEFRYDSPRGDNFEYVLGAFFQHSTLDFQDSIKVPADSLLVALGGPRVFLADTQAAREAQTKTDSWSVFASGTMNLSPSVSLTAGGRYTEEEKEGSRSIEILNIDGTPLATGNPAAGVYLGGFLVDEHDIEDKLKESSFSPDVKLLWDVNDDILLYTSYSVGYKSGGFDFRANNPGLFSDGDANDDSDFLESFSFDAEKATNYEFGGKTSFWNGRGELNFAIYNQKFSDLQVSIYDGTLGFNVGNAASATSKGVELDGRLALSEGLTMNYAAAVSDFEYDEFPNGQCSLDDPPDAPPPFDGLGLCDYSGERSQLHSKFQGNVGLQYERMIADRYELKLNGDVNHTSSYNPAATLDRGSKQPGYELLDIRVGLSSLDTSWSLALLGKNMLDERIVTYTANHPLAFSSFGAPSRTANVARPRTITLQLRHEF